MSKPNLPAPHAPRPDPGGQLLEAVQQRQSQRSLQLALQWVHRRGIADLQRFCSTDLSSALGTEAATWLQDLLAQDAPIASRSDALLSPPGGLEPSADRLQGQPAPAQELQARAVAAVDEAFAALAQSFLEENQAPIAGPLPLAAQAASAAPMAAPQPMPAGSGLWPSLRAATASLNAAAPAEGSTLQRPAPDGQSRASEPLVQTGGLPSGEAAAPSNLQPLSSPTALQEAAPLAPEPDCAADAALSNGQPIPADAPGQVGLAWRLRARIQAGRLPRLSRLRAVMRDCVQETMALLHPPEPQRLNDDVDFELQPPPETAALPREQPNLSWTVDPLLPGVPAINTGIPTEPEAAAAQTAAPEDDGSSVPTALGGAPAPRQRFGVPTIPPSAGGDRPAPAPAGLSDLRAWLPDRGDLPRAS